MYLLSSSMSSVSFKVSISILIFCLGDLFIDVSEVLKSLSLIVLPSISPCVFVEICFMYLGAPMLGTYIFTVVLVSSFWIAPFIISNIHRCILLQPWFYLPFWFWGPHKRHNEGFQARGLMGAVATGLHHSHSNTRSKPHLQPTPQLMATLDP